MPTKETSVAMLETDERKQLGEAMAERVESLKTDQPANGETQDAPIDSTQKAEPELPSHEAEILAEIVEMNRECSLFESRMVMAKEDAKNATKAWESAVKRLQILIRQQDEPMPLFDRKPEPLKPVEEWRDVDIDVLTNHGLSEAIVEKLRDSSFQAIGSLADWTASDNLLTAIDGIGPKKAEAIESSLEGFWAANPQHGQAEAKEHVEKIDAEANGEAAPAHPDPEESRE